MNDDFTSITGYTLAEAVGRSPGELLQGPATEPEAVERIRSKLKEDKPFADQLTNYRKNGEIYPCKLVIHPIFNRLQELINFIAFEVDGHEVKDESRIPFFNLSPKYQSSSLKGIDEVRLFSRLKDCMEQDQLYLDPDLSLRKLAECMDTNTKYLSQVINHCSGQNLQTFINTYRINAVKRALEAGDHDNLTLFGIAQQCGFKNKSTFYKVFKDLTGLTPKDYVYQLT